VSTYLFAYHANPDEDPNVRPTDAELAQAVAAWRDWYGRLGAALVDGGNPVARSVTVSETGIAVDGGGPNPVSGYTIVSSGSLEDAADLAKGSPALADGGTVEVCEMLEVM